MTADEIRARAESVDMSNPAQVAFFLAELCAQTAELVAVLRSMRGHDKSPSSASHYLNVGV